MKIALICYHKNISTIYPVEWIDKFRESILNQTHKEFDIVEVNYGSLGERIFEQSEFIVRQSVNFVETMNYLLDLCTENGYDYVFNSNVDDHFALNRIERQLTILQNGYDIVSSNFVLIDDKDKELFSHKFHLMNIKRELMRNHNIIGHPSVAYSRKFFERERYDPTAIPFEDLNLWKRTIDQYSFHILPDQLLFHRIHSNSVCQSTNR